VGLASGSKYLTIDLSLGVHEANEISLSHRSPTVEFENLQCRAPKRP
jgi:hypothetical protein